MKARSHILLLKRHHHDCDFPERACFQRHLDSNIVRDMQAENQDLLVALLKNICCAWPFNAY